MTSLQRRLTLSYTVLVGVFISVVAAVLTWMAFDATIRPIGDAIAAAGSSARAIIAAEPHISPDSLVKRVRALTARSDVAVFVAPVPPRSRRGVPDSARPAGGPPEPGDGPVGIERVLNAVVGVHGEIVRMSTAQLVIVPELDALGTRMRLFAVTLLVVLVTAAITAWLIARWIAGQAVAPLAAVTTELHRFAGGDFSPREVQLRGISDVGDLIAAYNGAAAQVAAAFEERERGEERMRRFLADAGHELRTPLAIVTAYIAVLRKDSDDPHLRAKALETLATETKRMRLLVDRLVALARLEQPETTKPVVVDVGVLARDAVAAIVAARAGDVSCEVESGTFVLADAADLHEAISNLVDNAVKYGGGSLVRVAVEHQRDVVAVRVSDCGPGIPPSEREKIFERFYRGAAQEGVEGSGLGLAIAARAAQRAGGELTLEPPNGFETAFVVRLPLFIAEIGQKPAAPPVMAPPLTAGESRGLRESRFVLP